MLNYMIVAAACFSVAIGVIDYFRKPIAEKYPKALPHLMGLRRVLIVVTKFGAYAAILWFVRELVISRQ